MTVAKIAAILSTVGATAGPAQAQGPAVKSAIRGSTERTRLELAESLAEVNPQSAMRPAASVRLRPLTVPSCLTLTI